MAIYHFDIICNLLLLGLTLWYNESFWWATAVFFGAFAYADLVFYVFYIKNKNRATPKVDHLRYVAISELLGEDLLNDKKNATLVP